MSDMDDKDRSRDRSRRERPTRFSESSRDRSHDRGRDRGGMKSSNCRVYVSNIPYEYRWQDMKDLFRSQVGDVQFVELFVDENDKSRGCGIVEFSDPSSVKKCMEVMQRFEVKTRKLIIKEDSGTSRDKHGNIVGSGSKRNRDEGRYREDRYDPPSSRRSDPMAGGGGASEGGDKWGNTYGLSPHFLESLRIDTPLCNRVFVANLEYNVDKKKIKEVFRLAGRIIRVDLHHDKDGRSRGFAVVEYDHPVEAVQAISMFHNQVLIDRPMTVRIDRANEQLKLPDGLKGIGMGLGTNGEPLKDVARNLPSLQNTQASNVAGAGILGAVPNSALQVASALTGLNNIGGTPFSSLAATPSSVLQAANLSSLLGANGLSSSDLSNFAASNLVSANPLGNSSSLLNTNSSSMGGGNMGGGSNTNNFSRGGGDNSYSSNQNSSSYGQNQSFNSGSGRNYQNYDSVKRESGGFQFGNTGRDSFTTGGSMGSVNTLGGGGGQLMRSQNIGGGGQHQGNNMKADGFSRKVLISNLPQSASYKVLTEKFSEFGDIQHLEEKGTGSMLVVYGADWQAERAIKNLDRARIDGRTIDARFFF